MQYAVREGARYAITGQGNLNTVDPVTMRQQRYSAMIDKIRDSSMGLYDRVKPTIVVNGASQDPDTYTSNMIGSADAIVVLRLDCSWPVATPAWRLMALLNPGAKSSPRAIRVQRRRHHAQRGILMNTLQRIVNKRKAAGSAAVEFAFMLPLLVLLAIPVFDFARVIQANMILINISREGANLASRTSETPQTIMNALAATAPPLDMGRSGMIYITRVMGHLQGGAIRNVIVQQDKWLAGGTAQVSAVWTCSAWKADGGCNSLPANPDAAPTANVMTGQLANGEVIYLVEGFYRANILFSAMDLGFGIKTPQFSPDLYAKTIF